MGAAVNEPKGGGGRVPPLSRRRRIACWALLILASLIGLVSVLTVWVDRQMLDNTSWEKASTDAIDDPAVRSAVSVYLVNQLYENVDVAAQLEQKLPPATKPLAAPISAALQQPLANGIEILLGRPRVQQLWINASTVAHQKLINVVENKTGYGIATGKGDVTLDLHQLVTEVAQELGLPSGALDKLPADAGTITLMKSDQLSTAQTAVRGIKAASAWLAVLVVAMFALAVYLARGARREMLRNVGWAFVFVGLVVLIIRRLAGNYVIDALVDPGYTRSGHRLWLIWTEILGQTGRAVVFYGVIVVVAAVLAGPGVAATATRRRLAPLLRERRDLVWGVVGLAFLLLVAWGPTYALRRPLWIAVFGALLVAGVEVLRRQTLREFSAELPAEQPAEDVRRRLKTPLSGRKESKPSPADEIAKLQQLKDAGAIGEEEFDRGKQIALS
jgi:hypothetical protein